MKFPRISNKECLASAGKSICGAVVVVGMISACSPTVKVEMPDKPIKLQVDLNIKHEIRLKVEKDLDQAAVEPAIPLAKKSGWIGEQNDGYLGLVRKDTPAEITDLIKSANENRRGRYEKIASANKVEVESVETIAGRRLIASSLTGEYIQADDDSWVRK
jgi:uncharacterized protein YdbL (DUF1318 family)